MTDTPKPWPFKATTDVDAARFTDYHDYDKISGDTASLSLRDLLPDEALTGKRGTFRVVVYFRPEAPDK